MRAAVSIRGIFDLEPLLATTMNEVLGLDHETARAGSPLFWSPLPSDRALVAVAGELESSEFRRQSRDIAERWGVAGLRTEYLESSATNHYTVVDELARSDSELFARVMTMAVQVHGG